MAAWAVLAMVSLGWGQDNPKQAFLDAKDAGPDFQTQGEYVGKLGDQSFGVQVVALGNGNFDAVIYPGGLPGAGFNGEAQSRSRMKGKTEGSQTVLTGKDDSAEIRGESLILKSGSAMGELKKVMRESPTLGARPPANAIVLFDGTHVDHWTPGQLEGNLMGIGTRTKQKFEDFTLHLEFRTPFMPFARGQGRGNSGMYLGDQYECQILDSFGLEGENNECGGIYTQSRPRVNMCLPPLSWQTYDVEFTCAKFDGDGKVVSPARTTIKHNGVVIQDNLELKVTPGGSQNDQKPGALFLQNHGDPVRFRNIWIVPKS